MAKKMSEFCRLLLSFFPFHPSMVSQDHQPKSHYQNADTFHRLCGQLLDYVNDVRISLGDANAPACLILDAAGQHWGETTVQMMHDQGVIFAGVQSKGCPIPPDVLQVYLRRPPMCSSLRTSSSSEAFERR